MSFVQFAHETDERLMRFVSKLQHPIITSLFLPVTHSTAPFTVISILTVLSFFSLYANIYHKELIFLFFSVFPVVIGSYIKKKVNRARPSEDNIKICVKEKSADFPSTHAAVACSVWGLIAYFQNANPLARNIAISIALLVSFSRCILGVHNPSSVTAGMLLGFLWLQVLVFGYENIPDYYFHSYAVLFFLIIGWIFVAKYYKKYPEDIPRFLRKPSKVTKRVYTGILVFLLCFVPIWKGGIWFKLFMGTILAFGFYEIYSCSRERMFAKIHLKIIGSIFFAAMVYLTFALREIPSGYWYILLVVFIAALSDISGWAVGFFGGKIKIPVLAKISPNKTLEGFLAALAIPTITVGSVLVLTTSTQCQLCYIVCFVLSLASVVGDLLESLFKRSLRIKDFSNFLPGHGGILDRVDSHLLAASILYFLAAAHIFRI